MHVAVMKSKDESLKQATFVVLVPDVVDEHEETYSEEEVRKACHSFNSYCRKANILHLVDTDDFSIVESYVAPSELTINDTIVTKGTWLAVCQFKDDNLWEGVKKGTYNGLSIQAYAVREDVDNDN